MQRRELAKLIGAAAMLPSIGWSAPKYHEQIVDRVRRIRSFGARKLTLLCPKGSLGNLKTIAEMFQKQTGVEVLLKEGALDQLASEMILSHNLPTGKGSFDVALPPTFAIPNLVEAGVLLDLTKYAEDLIPKGFSESTLYRNGNEYQKKLYGFQTDGDVYLLFLRKSWLFDPKNRKSFKERYGRTLDVPLTWEELDRQIEFFSTNQKSGGLLFRNKNYAVWEFYIRLHSRGLLPFGDNVTPQIAQSGAVRALESMVQISPFLDKSVWKNDLFANFKEFAKGQSYCNLGWGGTQKYLRSAPSTVRDDVMVCQTPGAMIDGTARPISYFNWGWNYVVHSKCLHKEVAALFTMYATSPWLSTLAVREQSGYFDPFRKEHYQDPEIRKIYGTEFLTMHSAAMSNAIPDLYLKGQNKYMAVLKQAIDVALTGQVAPQLALESAAKKWSSLSAEMGIENQNRQWKLLKQTYPGYLQKFLKV